MTVVRRRRNSALLAVALLPLALGVYGVRWGDFLSGAFLLALGALLVVHGIVEVDGPVTTAAYGGVFLFVGVVGLAQGILEANNDVPLAAVDLVFGLAAVALGVRSVRARPAR